MSYNNESLNFGGLKHISYVNSEGVEVALDRYETNKFKSLGLDQEENEFLLEFFDIWLDNYTTQSHFIKARPINII